MKLNGNNNMGSVLITLYQKENQRLLVEALSKRHKVIVEKPKNVTTTCCDIWIIDGPMIEKERQVIEQLKSNEQEGFFPILLVVNRPDVGFITASLWKLIDEIILTPIEIIELYARVENLLNRRYLSINLEELVNQRTKELTILNKELTDSRLAALNILEDAVQTAEKLSKSNEMLKNEIEERKRAEEQLREPHRRLETLIGNLEGIVYRCKNDRNWTMEFVSQGCLKLTGYAPDELLGNRIISYKDLIHPDYREYAWKLWQKALPEKKHVIIEYPIITKNGETKWVWEQGCGIYNEKDEVIALEGFITDITERKRVEQALFESEQRFRRLAENAQDIIYRYEFKPKRGFTYVSPAATPITGYTPEEHYADPDLGMKIIHPDDLHILQNLSEINNSDPKPLVFRWIKKDGSIIWTEQRNVAIFDDKGELIAIEGIARDITEQKLAEEKLIESNLRLELAMDIANMAWWQMELPSGNVFFNSRKAEVLGYTPDKFKHYTDFTNLLHPEDYEKTMNAMINHLNGLAERYEVEYRILTKDGNYKWLYDIGAVSKRNNESGEMLITGFVLDITERKLAEQKIQENERFLSSLFDSVGDAILTMSMPDRKIVQANKAVSEIFGYKLEELVGNQTNILYPSEEEFLDYGEKIKNAIINNEPSVKAEVQLVKKDGTKIWCDFHTTFIKHNGSITYLITIVRDITEKKKLIEDLIAAKEKAEEMNRVKSYFFANMSHELRTPFVGIKGFAEILDEMVEEPEIKSMVQGILVSSNRLIDTLNKILQLSKIEFNEIEIELNEANINEILNESYNLYIKTAGQKNLQFTKNISFNDLVIKSDERLLREILNNIINNAIKYTEKGKIELHSEIQKRNDAEYLIIKVSDTGIGIPKEKQELIWQEFRQVSEGMSRRFEGTGLGLTITKKYVELLGGKISLESELGKGSTFTIEIPIERVLRFVLKNQNDNVANIIEEETFTSRKKILYVEDDDLAKDIVLRVLSKKYNVELANNAKEAMVKVSNNNYDLLLIDINLGREKDGLELMQEIKILPKFKKTPMIAVTAYASDDDRDEFLSKGFTHYISKPFSINDLKKLVSEVLKD